MVTLRDLYEGTTPEQRHQTARVVRRDRARKFGKGPACYQGPCEFNYKLSEMRAAGFDEEELFCRYCNKCNSYGPHGCPRNFREE